MTTDIINEVEREVGLLIEAQKPEDGRDVAVDLHGFDVAPFKVKTDRFLCTLIGLQHRGGFTIFGYTEPRIECQYRCKSIQRSEAVT